jgi:tRNA G18 (ribose-2'-O)-methylase SpoU
MANMGDSLNVASAAAILLFEAKRQRCATPA